jgi:hypothetical protein
MVKFYSGMLVDVISQQAHGAVQVSIEHVPKVLAKHALHFVDEPGVAVNLILRRSGRGVKLERGNELRAHPRKLGALAEPNGGRRNH